MSSSRRKKKNRMSLREALLIVALAVMTVALILAVLLTKIRSDKENTPTQTPTTVTVVPTTTPADPPESSQTTAPVTTPTVPTTTIPAPTTTTAPVVTTPSPVTTQPKPETKPPVTAEGDYEIDMTDYMDAIDPTGDLWDDAYLMLVNADHPIERNQESQYDALKNRPKFSSSSDYRFTWKPNIQLNETAMKALAAMFNEAAADGITDLDVTSAYRDYDYQKGLFDKNCNKTYHWVCDEDGCNVDWIGKSNNCPICGSRTSDTIPITREEQEENVATYSCAPGTSDHQTGLAVDIIQKSLPSRFDSLLQEFGETDAGKWLAANCYRFGFILRFPPDKEAETGIIYEPWHFRYVGRTHATAMHDMNLCLEEYVEYLESTGYFD